jgi:hypothetical protein
MSTTQERRRKRTDEEILAVQRQEYGTVLEIAIKSCRECGKKLTLSSFTKDRSYEDGLSADCKKCVKERTTRRKRKLEQRTEEELAEARAKSKRIKSINEKQHKQCTGCLAWKTLDQFWKDSTRTDGLACRCSECERQKMNRNQNKAIEIKYNLKLNQPCETCGESDPIVLEFAHISRQNKYRTKTGKTFSIGQMFSMSRIAEEVKKVKILCCFCHRLETKNEDESTRTQKPDCYNASYFEMQQNVNKMKQQVRCCVDCKRQVTQENCRGFDYDHLGHEPKIDGVAAMVTKRVSMKIIEAEIEKCELVCANCHRKRTKLRSDNEIVKDVLNKMLEKISKDSFGESLMVLS